MFSRRPGAPAQEPRAHSYVTGGKRYPAKHIRGLAYQEALGRPISKQEFSGGRETADFFRRLGFRIEYEPTHLNKTPAISRPQPQRTPGISSVVRQKNALQRLLQRRFGIMETERSFPWMRTPTEPLPVEYRALVSALKKHRGHKGFLSAGRSVQCDMVFEKNKLIVEYDENQHFSKARLISLQHYPSNSCGDDRSKANSRVNSNSCMHIFWFTRIYTRTGGAYGTVSEGGCAGGSTFG